MNEVKNDKLTETIISACFEVHNHLGPGFREKNYQNALKIALRNRKLNFKCEQTYCVNYKNSSIGNFRMDFIVEDQIVLEIKAVKGFMPKLFESQLTAYLKATNMERGLLINFGNSKCVIRRLMNNDLFNHRPNHRHRCPITASSLQSLPHHRNQSQRERR